MADLERHCNPSATLVFFCAHSSIEPEICLLWTRNWLNQIRGECEGTGEALPSWRGFFCFERPVSWQGRSEPVTTFPETLLRVGEPGDKHDGLREARLIPFVVRPQQGDAPRPAPGRLASRHPTSVHDPKRALECRSCTHRYCAGAVFYFPSGVKTWLLTGAMVGRCTLMKP